MAVMVVTEDMAAVILKLCTFKERVARKQLQNHRQTIGTIAVSRKAIIHMSKSVQMDGCKLSLSHLHNKEKDKR